jgi:hypothetical protein
MKMRHNVVVAALIAIGHAATPHVVEAVKGTVYFHVLEAVLMVTPLYSAIKAWYAFWTGDA